jgi:hypothetical protein
MAVLSSKFKTYYSKSLASDFTLPLLHLTKASLCCWMRRDTPWLQKIDRGDALRCVLVVEKSEAKGKYIPENTGGNCAYNACDFDCLIKGRYK